MKIDYHIHLEEGPYSLRWLDRTNRAMHYFETGQTATKHTKEWLSNRLEKLTHRVRNGSYDAKWLDLYLQRAKQLGLKEVGIVDHLYRFTETRAYFEKHIDISHSDVGQKQYTWLNQVMTESMAHFVQLIEDAKPKWAKEGVQLKLGMEADYFSGSEEMLASLLAEYDWDYIIGSTHFIHGWGFDNPDTQDRFEEYDLFSLYADFFAEVKKSIQSGLFDVIAHLDNLKVFKKRPDEQLLLPFYEDIAKTLVETDTATEVNAGLYYRYPIQEMCPSPLFLSVLVNHGVKFITSSDAHFPDDLGAYIEDNTNTLREKGVQQVCTFHQRKRTLQLLG